jgi:Heterokaryon incompatibility protein (HET)
MDPADGNVRLVPPPPDGRPRFGYRRSLSWKTCRLIHIIELSPIDSDNPDNIEIALAEADLDSSPKYDAISYCWGGQKPEIEITCNGMIMKITQNLADAIRSLRQDITGPIRLWADASASANLTTKRRAYRYT